MAEGCATGPAERPWTSAPAGQGTSKVAHGPEPKEACYGNRCGASAGLESGLGPHRARPGPSCPSKLASRDTFSFHLAPQIEPPSHHFSPEEVRVGVMGGAEELE